ncbi:hypothetical protein EG329_010619 [Mollisiaceae sp. DMI_Dod_QoI]|nr:hypothetical protein EG329_010619 [Helotiales sp. DMI_Dod_QoI]
MTSVQNPTYLLAPNWTYRPGGPIALGNIVVDPFRPHRVLSKPTDALPDTETATEKNWRLAIEKVRSINVSIWTQLFQQASFKLAAQNEKTKSGSFTMKSLDTIYFKDEPSIEEITERVKEPRIRNIMKADSLFRSPVYMVTGLKIAKEFQLTHEDSSKVGVTVEGSGTVAPEASVGVSVDASSSTKLSDGFEASNDIIFAYQLLKIKPKGWGKDQTIQTDEFHHKAAFLGDDGEEEEEDEDIEVEKGAVAVDDVVESQEGITAGKMDDHQYAWLFESEGGQD